jgi:hypothetical protein
MNIVIVGARERTSEEDKLLVCDLVEGINKKYPQTVFVTAYSPEGVGKFVKDKCSERHTATGEHRFQLVLCDVWLYAKGLTRVEASTIYVARNATLFELGDMFYYLADRSRRGTMEDLINNRVIPASRPYKVLLPGDGLELL